MWEMQQNLQVLTKHNYFNRYFRKNQCKGKGNKAFGIQCGEKTGKGEMTMNDTTLIAHEYETCGKIWKRVAPELAPYPPLHEDGGMTREELLALPGAEEDPCCMGTQAQLAIDVLRGFWQEELADRRRYEQLARHTAQVQARRLFRRLAAEEAGHARKLSAALYLITGEKYSPKVYFGALAPQDYCVQLRELYHEEACGGFNYARAAQETNDLCLKEMLAGFSADEYRHARSILELLSCAVE